MTGTVAPAIARYLTGKNNTIIRWDREAVPVDDYALMEKFISSQKATHFFHVATGSPLWAERVAEICLRFGIRFIFTSSVSVFSENSPGPFTTDHQPDATDDYGCYKIECENRIRSVNHEAIIARLGWQIGDSPGSNNMVDFLFKTMSDKGLIEASSLWYPACSLLPDSAEALHTLALGYPPGTYHIDGNPGFSFLEIVKALNEKHGNSWNVVESFLPERDSRMLEERIKVRSIAENLPFDRDVFTPGDHMSYAKRDENVLFDIIVRVKPETVYDALTTAEGLNGWFTSGTSIDAKPGGKLLFRWKNWGPSKYTGELGGPVLEAERPSRFVFQWPVDSRSYLTTVEIDIESHPEGCLVRLVESGYDTGPDSIRDMLNRAAGWSQALLLMKMYLEHGIKY